MIGGSVACLALLALVTVFFGWKLYWTIYSNEAYGFEFKYPRSWELNQTANGFLDILVTTNATDGPECLAGFRGIQIQVGKLFDQKTDFTSFVRSQVISNGIGLYPSGKIIEKSVNEHQVFKIQNSGWDSVCSGPGYFIQQGAGRYAYVYTGGDKVDPEYWDLILMTFKFK